MRPAPAILVGALLVSGAARGDEDVGRPEDAAPADDVKPADDAAGDELDRLPSPDALEPAERKKVADGLFQSAHAALEADDWTGACAKFRASMRYDISVSTQLNIARCHEHEGDLVAAWADYNRARLLNRDTPEVERREALAAYTEAAVAKLEVRLPRLRVVVPSPPADLVVLSDDRALGPLAAGEPVPLNPGMHQIEVRAPGYRTERRAIELVEGKLIELVVTLSPAVDTDETVEAMETPLPPPETPPPSPEPVLAAGAETPIWAWLAGSGGVVLAAVAIGLGVDSAGARGELADNCADRGGTFACPTTRYDKRGVDALVSRSNLGLGLAVGLGGASIAALTAAAIGLATGDGAETAGAAPWITPDGGGLAGSWRF